MKLELHLTDYQLSVLKQLCFSALLEAERELRGDEPFPTAVADVLQAIQAYTQVQIPQSVPGLDPRLSELYKDMAPGVKLEIIEAMGFTPIWYPHQLDCPGINPGFVCNCVPDGTMWSQPEDVNVFTHQTYDERRDRALKRDKERDK